MQRKEINYMFELKGYVGALIEREFEDVNIYLSNPEYIPAFGVGGTFCIEAAASGVETRAEHYGQVYLALYIWTYLDGDDLETETEVAALAQRLEAALLATASFSTGAGLAKLETEYIHTDYLKREKGRAFRRRRVRAARTLWRVRFVNGEPQEHGRPAEPSPAARENPEVVEVLKAMGYDEAAIERRLGELYGQL